MREHDWMRGFFFEKVLSGWEGIVGLTSWPTNKTAAQKWREIFRSVIVCVVAIIKKKR
jgi:hypothetical protein